MWIIKLTDKIPMKLTTINPMIGSLYQSLNPHQNHLLVFGKSFILKWLIEDYYSIHRNYHFSMYWEMSIFLLSLPFPISIKVFTGRTPPSLIPYFNSWFFSWFLFYKIIPTIKVLKTVIVDGMLVFTGWTDRILLHFP